MMGIAKNGRLLALVVQTLVSDVQGGFLLIVEP